MIPPPQQPRGQPSGQPPSTPWADRPVVRLAAPLLIGLIALGGWEAFVHLREIPEYVLPAPSVIAQTLWEDRAALTAAWLVTVKTMLAALAAAVVGGVLLAMLFSVSRALEISLFPYAIVLQVTPLIAIAPLMVIWLDGQPWLVLVLCAWIVAFFPILSNTVVGLKSADPNLRDLMRLYGAGPWQRLRHLLAPTALPYFLAGFKIAANLALVGAVVGEFVVGVAGEQTGLASRILESSFRLEIPRMYAAMALISLTGIAVYFALHAFTAWALSPWHESAADKDY